MIRRVGTFVSVEASRARQLRRCSRPRTSSSWFRPLSPSTTSTTTLRRRQLWQTMTTTTTTTSASAALTAVSVDHAHRQSAFAASDIPSLLILGGAALLLSSALPTKTLTEGTAPSTDTPSTDPTDPSSSSEAPPKPIPFEKFATKGQWKDGLLYDNPEDDEETHCSFCRLYRQGPCRPFWRPLELCLNYKKDENGDRIDCQDLSNRFIMDCLSEYNQLYTLIELQEWQDEVIDETDLHERRSAYQDLWALSKQKKNQTLPQTLSSSTTLEPPETVPERVQKILANDRLYQHMLDNYMWNQAIQMDWRRWAKYVHIMKWKRDDLQLMIESEANFRKLKPPLRPVWWSTAPSLDTEGMDQIVEFITHYHTEQQQQQQDGEAPSVPWPLQQRPDDEEHDVSLIRNTASTLFSNNSNKEKTALEGEAYWHHLSGNPMLVPLPVRFPKKHPRQKQCELLYAYGRDADTGMLLGYYFEPEKKKDNDNDNDASEASNSNSTSSTSEAPTSQKEEQDNGEAPAANANPDATQNKEDNDDDDAVLMLVHLLPGRTSSFQLFAVYSTDDSYSVMETAPISVIDSIFVPSELNPDEEDVMIHDSPQGLNQEDVRERFERYQVLHNFCKYQLTATMAAVEEAEEASSLAAAPPPK